MSRIFISYRTEDSPGYFGRLRASLEDRMPHDDIFMPAQDIDGGALFPDELRAAVERSDALVVLIGRYWLTRPTGERRDLSSDVDYVRLEIVTALERGIKVIPVLVDGATIPPAGDLPPALHPMLTRQAIVLSDTQWSAGCDRLVKSIDPAAVLPGGSNRDAATASQPAGVRALASLASRHVVAAGLAGLVVVTAVAWVVSSAREPEPPSETLLSIDVERAVIVQTPGNREIPILDSVQLQVRPGETVRVDVARQNPLLFTYDSTITAEADYGSAVDFARQLGDLLTGLPTSAGSDMRPVTVRGLNFDSLRQDLGTVRELVGSLGDDLAASLSGPSQVEALKQKYRTAGVEGLAGRIANALNEVAAITRTCIRPTALLTTDAGSVISCNGPAAIGLNVELTQRTQSYRAKLQRLQDIEKKLEGPQSAQDQPEGSRDELQRLHARYRTEAAEERADLEAQRTVLQEVLRPTLGEFVAGLIAIAPSLERQIALLKSVNTDVTDLDRSRTLLTTPYDATTTTATTVRIGPQSKYDRFLSADTRRRRDAQLRTMKLMFVPS